MTKQEFIMTHYNEETTIIRRNIANWLRPYTDAVIKKVIANIEEVLKNQVALNMLNELYRGIKRGGINYREEYDITNYDPSEIKELPIKEPKLPKRRVI